MTIFVIDAPVAIDLATSGAAIPAEHSLAAPTLLRSQGPELPFYVVGRVSMWMLPSSVALTW